MAGIEKVTSLDAYGKRGLWKTENGADLLFVLLWKLLKKNWKINPSPFCALIIVIALWMLWRTWRGEQMFKFEQGDDHHHGEHDHAHHDETHRIDTGHGRIELSIFEEGMPPRWRLRTLTGHAWAASDVRLMTTRPDGSTQSFSFVERKGFLESAVDIPEPHEFSARLNLGHAGHAHDYDLTFRNMITGTRIPSWKVWSCRLMAIRIRMNVRMPTTSVSASPTVRSPRARSSCSV
jgi:hypothetical protein